jgi:hypothetical protein
MMTSIIMTTTNAAIAMSHIGDMAIDCLVSGVEVGSWASGGLGAGSAETSVGLATIRHDAARKMKTSSRAALLLMLIQFYWAVCVVKAFL